MSLNAKHSFTLTVNLEPPVEAGMLPTGYRRIVPITGGTVDGPDLQGEILPGGADWNTIGPDGTVSVWARYDFRTSDGAIVGVINAGTQAGGGEIDPASFALITHPVFEASAEAPSWLNSDTFAGVLRPAGPDQVRIEVYRLGIA